MRRNAGSAAFAASLPALASAVLAGAWALRTPGAATVAANVPKAEPLEATPERIATLRVPDGSLLVGEERNGVSYRVSYAAGTK